MDLHVTIAVNITSTEFLDVRLDLEQRIYRPFMKPNNLPRYIHIGSNHPKSVKDQLPKMKNEQLINLSISKSVFNKCKSQYQDALNESIKYRTEEQQPGKKNRSRNIIWFNPPYRQSVKTNI